MKKPRTIFNFGMQSPPLVMGETWIESEMACTDHGQFRRRALVRHKNTGKLVSARADIPDTYFSIPATTDTEHGYITSTEGELEFRPHTKQTESPAQFRKSTKAKYK